MNGKDRGHLYTETRGEGEPLLMIHGIISDSTFFSESADILGKSYQVITYDRRGYGKSREESYESFTVSEQAQDAADVLRALCTKPAWVVGYSTGGLIAIELALQFPELVRGLLLLEPSLGYDAENGKRLMEWNRELNQYVQEGRAKQALVAFTRVTGPNEDGKRKVSLLELQNVYRNLETFLHGELNEVQHYQPPVEDLRGIKAPVTVGVTEKGKDGIFATSSLSGANIIGWPVLWFPGNHNVGKDRPQEFADRVRECFASAK
ncbi:MAG: alpha/beta hydrolase [Lachnospiraceae bacterium]|nr:alpha/beta hydrolase [Lachnospiraceae bacterium]